MEPSKEAIAVRIARLNRHILGKVTSGTNKLKKTIDRETLLDALTVLYDECNDDPVKKCDELVKAFVDKYRSTLVDLRRTRVCLSDFEMLQTIGRGHFGEVHMVREKQTSDVYALKVVRKEQATRASGAGEERDVLAAATTPWMPRLQYAFQDNASLYLVMELCVGGDLAGLLSRRNHPLSERDAAFYVAEVAHALKALHGMGYVHRDVKPHNILLDRCGHVKLGDFGSCARLSEGGGACVGTADYVAPELLAAADCAARHAVCLQYCRGIVHAAISACDYWSLGVVAFELVTLRRPFSSGDEDTIAQILSNIQKYEREVESEPPFEPAPNGPSATWRALVGGLLRVQPARRYSYLDILQHAALAHLASHNIRDQPPPWVPHVRGAEDACCFQPAARERQPPSAAPFRARPPFAGQLPFVGYSYVAAEEPDDSSGGFNASHDCTAIDLATFKSAEKLAAMRGREIASLQSKLAAAEAAVGAEAEKTRRAADAEAERQRARLQAEITALSLQNRRLERQIEVEKEERMALERTNQQLASNIADRTNAELRAAQATVAEVQAERDALGADLRRLEARVSELQAECARATALADSAQQQQKHYKDILLHAQELRHRRLTEINVKAIDTIAKERALRRQTLTGGEAESREAGARVAQAEASVARETRAREQLEKRLAAAEEENASLHAEVDQIRRELARAQETLGEKNRYATSSTEQLKEAQTQLAQERARVASLLAQVQELERGMQEAGRREAALEEQCARTEARLHERLDAADARAASALQDDARHREKVNTLEQLVRQLEREVTALEARACANCEAREGDAKKDAHSDTESVGDAASVAHTQVAVIKEQLERAEAQLQARADEIATLRQEARTANLARWRKEREFNELQVEAKSTARELKRTGERLSAALEAKRTAEQKASTLQSEMAILKPQHERASKEVDRLKQQLEKLQKAHETAQAEVDRSRNDIRKLKSELQYSEKRRMHAEEQEELSSRERAQLRDEMTEVRAQNNDLVQMFSRINQYQLELDMLQIGIGASFQQRKRKVVGEKPPVRPKPAYLRALFGVSSRVRDGCWARRVRLALAADLLQGRCRATDAALLALNAHFDKNNKALQEACSLLEEQLTDLENLADMHEIKNKDLEAETQRMRSELEACRTRLCEAERAAAASAAAAGAASQQSADARGQAHHAHCQLQLLTERLENREARVAELEMRASALEGERLAAEAALGSAVRRVRELQEECATLRTRARDHHARALSLQASLDEAQVQAQAQEEVAAVREANEAATAWWRTRETKADATLRQQAKLIDFLQAKVEEAGRKKCSLSNKLFGRSGRRTATSPPLRRANRELREEIDRLRAKLSACTLNGEAGFPPTPRREKPKPAVNGKKSIDTPDGPEENTLQIIWSDGSRERMRAGCSDGVLVLTAGDREVRARLLAADARNLEMNEANRAFSVLTDKGEATVVCSSTSSRAGWVSRLTAAAPAGYAPAALLQLASQPDTALYVAPNAIAIGCTDGLHSLRGVVSLELDCEVSPPRQSASTGVVCCTLCAAAGRALVVWSGQLLHAGLLALGSALRRAGALRPGVALSRVRLPDLTPPHLVKAISCDVSEGPCAVVACGRRVFLLRFEASSVEFKIVRSLTVDRPANSLLLTDKSLYIAGEKPLKINLPSGALEAFGLDEPIIAAAAKKHSPPKAILLVRDRPTEILLCYAECGVFVDENGKRTRNEDPKWSSAVQGWEFINPFLYLVGEEKITIIYITEEAYRAPPCTCDTRSLASTTSECYMPEKFNLKIKEPALLGTAPSGIIIRSKTDNGYSISIVEGMAAFKSVGASIESLETISDTKGSSSDLGQSMIDLAQSMNELVNDVSHESVEPNTGFLADIRKRAQQLAKKRHKDKSPEDVIKEILTTEVGLKRSSTGRKSPAMISESESETDSEDMEQNQQMITTKGPADLCAEMFTRQVRFQPS